MKRIILIIITSIIFPSVLTAQAEFVEGGLKYKVIADNNNNVCLVGRDTTQSQSDYIKNDTLYVPSVIERKKIRYNVVSVEQDAFRGCMGFTCLVLPDGITSVESKAFADCCNLCSVFFSKSIAYISPDALQGCVILKKICIDEHNAVYDSRGDCNAVIERAESVLILGCSGSSVPEGVRRIGEHAFDGCKNLKNISLPSSLESIGNEAFIGCCGLSSIKIPAKVNSIGSRVFAECSMLNEISVDAGNSTYDSRGRCNAIIETSTSTLVAGAGSMIVPDGCRKIRYGACYGIDKLTSLHIPASVIQIDSGAIMSCRLLSKITVDSDNEMYDSRYGCNAVVESHTSKLILGCPLTNLANSIGITHIGDMAFWGMSPTVVDLPSTIQEIGTAAFACSDHMQMIRIPDYVTSIGARACMACGKLQEAIIGDGVTVLPEGLFAWCKNLKVVKMPSQLHTMQAGCLIGCENMKVVYIPHTVSELPPDATDGSPLIIYYP